MKTWSFCLKNNQMILFFLVKESVTTYLRVETLEFFQFFFMKKSIENILKIYVIIMLFGILSKREFLNMFFNEFSSSQRSFTFCKIRRLLTFFPFPLFFYWHVLWTLSLLNLGGFINKTSQVWIQSYHQF